MDIKIDIKIGGWAKTDNLWEKFIEEVSKFDYDISYKRFDKNYGKSFIINDLSKDIDNYDYMLTLDSDIIFIDNNPIKRLINLSKKMPSYLNKKFGFLSLNQRENNCHLVDTLNKSFKWANEVVKWNENGGGIAGGCLFISKENWKEVNGYRKNLKNYDSDDHYLLVDTLKNGRSFGLAESIEVIHPDDKDDNYSKWKLDSVTNEKGICFFSSYSEKKFIDNYIKFYLENLKCHFDDVILVTNDRKINSSDIKFLKNIGVTLKRVKNEGFDFGMWSKCFNDEKIDIFNYNKIGLVNDSSILFDHKNFSKLMKWANSTDSKYCSITESNEISHHLQSYFLIVKGEGIKKVYEYFREKGILNDRNEVIKHYEIGLSKFLKKEGIKIESFFKNDTPNNPTTLSYEKLIDNGIPIIKKKLLLNTFKEGEIKFLQSKDFEFGFDWVSKIKESIKNDTTSVEYLIDKI